MKNPALLVASSLLLAVSFGANEAKASVIDLSFSQAPDSTYQQTTNSPCIFGPNSCQSPAFWTYQDTTGLTGTYALTSYTYTVSQIRNVLGNYNAFDIAIDVQTTGSSSPATEILNYFSVEINGALAYQYTNPLSTALPYGNSGSGFADDLLTHIDLSSYLGTDSVVFKYGITNATDGPETFFMTNASNPTGGGDNGNPAPEPGTLATLGLGLLGLGWSLKKGKAKIYEAPGT